VLRSDWTRKPAADVIQQWTATHPQTAPDAMTLAAMTDQLAAAATQPASLTAAGAVVPADAAATATTLAPVASTTPAPTDVPTATASAAPAAAAPSTG